MMMWIIPLVGLLCLTLGLLMSWVFQGPTAPIARPVPLYVPKPEAVDKEALLRKEASAADQRAFVRHETRQHRLLVSRADAPDSPYEALLINQSMGGLCLCMAETFPKGAVLLVRGTEEHPNTVQVEVRNCRQHRGGWAIGCQFVQGQIDGLLFN